MIMCIYYILILLFKENDTKSNVNKSKAREQNQLLHIEYVKSLYWFHFKCKRLEELNVMLIILKKYIGIDIRLMYRRINVIIFHTKQLITTNCKILLRKMNVKRLLT